MADAVANVTSVDSHSGNGSRERIDEARLEAGPKTPTMRPLVVDVDGTLIKSDFLYESALQLVAQSPLSIFKLVQWLSTGKAKLKTLIADRVELDVSTMPLQEETAAFIRQAQAEGRPVYLASASDRRYVEPLGARLRVDGVFATDQTTNLAGKAKASALIAAFGVGGFDYVGDADVDIPVWRAANRSFAVIHDKGVERRARAAVPDLEVLTRTKPRAKPYIKALRPHQWAKNALIFLPLIAGHQFSTGSVAAALLAFTCFCFAASSAYIINDLLDLPGDRDHATKRRRPFASGNVPVLHGIVISFVLIVAAFALALVWLPERFTSALLIYFLATKAYSLVLKRYVLIDVITLAGLYAIRVLAGVAAVGAFRSPWLLMFCLFLFLSLAIVKRCSELIARRNSGKVPPVGRGYQFADLDMLRPLGAAAGCGSIFVIALYLASPEVRALYVHPDRMWLICPILLYWICRVLIISNRGELHDDPVVFAIRDRVSWVCGAGVLGLLLASVG